jgi:enamine deaminase RidA (YjgF/YER057c/UK114 family)
LSAAATGEAPEVPFTRLGSTKEMLGVEYPYVPAIRVPAGCDLVFLSGATGLSRDGEGAPDLRSEVRRAFENLAESLALAGAGFDDVVSITKLLVDIERDNETVVEVMHEFFPRLPTSTTFEVSRLVPPDLRVEVNAVAAVRAQPK